MDLAPNETRSPPIERGCNGEPRVNHAARPEAGWLPTSQAGSPGRRWCSTRSCSSRAGCAHGCARQDRASDDQGRAEREERQVPAERRAEVVAYGSASRTKSPGTIRAGGAGLRGRNLVQPRAGGGPASSPTSMPSPVLPGAVRRSTSSAFSVTCSRSKWRSAAKLPAARISGAPSGGESVRFPRTTTLRRRTTGARRRPSRALGQSGRVDAEGRSSRDSPFHVR